MESRTEILNRWDNQLKEIMKTLDMLEQRIDALDKAIKNKKR